MPKKHPRIRLKVYDEFKTPIAEIKGTVKEVSKAWDKLRRRKLG